MLPRIIFVLFTIAFITFTWFYTGKAKSCHAVNEAKGTCKCKASWLWKDSNGNTVNSEATDNFQGCEDDCKSHATNVFCNNDCPKGGELKEEKDSKCPGRKDRYSNVQVHTCDCPFDTAIN